MVSLLKRSGTVLLLAIGSIACSPEGATFVEEQDVVYTNYNPSFDFAAQSTYALPDQVVSISNGGLPGDSDGPEYLPPQFANPILATLRSNMNAMGYREVAESADPDLIVLPSALQTTEIYYYYDWWYWNWYYPGYGPGWGWYYPGYYPPTVTSVRTGSIFIQMTSPKGIDTSNQIPVNWIAVVNGLLEGEGNAANRIDRTLTQAFTQSPYLQK
ncbi:DUF4136 domain-containing protein [Algoriphagus aestuariicola]|uniref:DUF4136 domain-containing protein n=1 Tax=Algoriphagus aestuariicola TaxID=1852016 RepID=A0ABS3BLY4_9BACT|nr:DUF4136 domain-containing protein [Algoriphagus aestuariicola]MBN7799849.1 DUF4136 domain-containing protein [Algoriphagus aestuariicola]